MMVNLQDIPCGDSIRLEGNCSFQVGPSFTTCMSFTVLYDKYGTQINHDPNRHQTAVHCVTHNKDFLVIQEDGNTRIEDRSREQS